MITRKFKILNSLIRFLVFETAPVEGFIQEVDKQGVMVNHNVFLLTDELIVLFDCNYNPIRSFKALMLLQNIPLPSNLTELVRLSLSLKVQYTNTLKTP